VAGHRHPLSGLPPGFKPLRIFASADGGMLAVGGDDAWRLEGGRWDVIPSVGVGDPARDASELVGLQPGLDVRQVARRADGLIAVANGHGPHGSGTAV
jgi:hypothetical protein